jgi:hypothetical protein
MACFRSETKKSIGESEVHCLGFEVKFGVVELMNSRRRKIRDWSRNAEIIFLAPQSTVHKLTRPSPPVYQMVNLKCPHNGTYLSYGCLNYALNVSRCGDSELTI